MSFTWGSSGLGGSHRIAALCGANFSLQGPSPGKALPGFKALTWLAQVGGVTWFFSRGPMKGKPSCRMQRLGSWGAAPPWLSGAGHPHRGLSSPQGPERLWVPSQPSARLTVLEAGWLRAGASGTRLGPGTASARFIQALLSSSQEGQGVPDGWKQVLLSFWPPMGAGLSLGPFQVGTH